MNLEAVFIDLDGTIIREETICQLIANSIGKSERMNELEDSHSLKNIDKSRKEILEWYKNHSLDELISYLENAKLGPGIIELCSYLNNNNIPFAIVSLTWSFAAKYFANLLGTNYYLGTEIDEYMNVTKSVLPEDKEVFIKEFTEQRSINLKNCIGIGDSWGDYPMIFSCGRGFLIGEKKRLNLPLNVREISESKSIFTQIIDF